jgi:hypothetical protein
MEDSFRQIKIVFGDFVIAGHVRSPDRFKLEAVGLLAHAKQLLPPEAFAQNRRGHLYVE